MKRIFVLAALMTMSCAPVVQSQSVVRISAPQIKDDLLAGTERFSKDAKNVTEVNLDPSMLGLVSKGSGDISDLAKKVEFIVVRSYEYENSGMYRMEDVDAVRNRLNGNNWNCFIHIRESKSQESTDICNRQGGQNGANEFVIVVAEKKEVTFVHMKGRMSLEDLQKLNVLNGVGVHVASPREPREPRPATRANGSTPSAPAAPSAPSAPAAPAAPPK